MKSKNAGPEVWYNQYLYADWYFSGRGMWHYSFPLRGHKGIGHCTGTPVNKAARSILEDILREHSVHIDYHQHISNTECDMLLLCTFQVRIVHSHHDKGMIIISDIITCIYTQSHAPKFSGKPS